MTRQGAQFTSRSFPAVFRLPPSATEGARADPPLLPLRFPFCAHTPNPHFPPPEDKEGLPTQTSQRRAVPRQLHRRLAPRLQPAYLCPLPSRGLLCDSVVGGRVARLTPRQSSLAAAPVACRKARHIHERASATAGSIVDHSVPSRSLTRSHHADPNGVTVSRWSDVYQSVELEAQSRLGKHDKAPSTIPKRRIKKTFGPNPIDDFCLAPLHHPRRQRRTRGTGGIRNHVLPRGEPAPIRPCPTRPVPGSEPAERPAFVFCSPAQLRPRRRCRAFRLGASAFARIPQRAASAQGTYGRRRVVPI